MEHEPRHLCAACGKDCTTRGGLTTHMMHCKKITFKCTHCNAEFASKAALDGHRKAHAPKQRPTAQVATEPTQVPPKTRLSREAQEEIISNMERNDAALERAVAENEACDEDEDDMNLRQWQGRFDELEAQLGTEAMNLKGAIADEGLRQHSSTWDTIRRKLKARGIGRGCDDGLSILQEGRYRTTARMLFAAALHARKLTEAALFEDLTADRSLTRALMQRALTNTGGYNAVEHLQRLRRIIEVCCKNGAHAQGEIRIAEAKAKKVVKTKEREKKLNAELKTIEDVLVQNETNKSRLPSTIRELKAKPALKKRLAVHTGLMRTTMKKLKLIEGSSGLIDPKTRDQETRDLIFDMLFLVSESVLPQRTSPWVTATWDVPVVFDEDMGIDTEELRKSPCFVCWREEFEQYGLCQLRTKTGISPWMPIPHEMTGLLRLYLTLLHAGYRECGYQKLEGTAIFPSSLGRCFSSSSFSGVQSNGFKRLNLEGATVFNSRHALADELTRLEIVPSNPSQAMLADSFAMGMNTSTAHLFGEKNVRELAHWGAYNRHGEAGGLRRKAAAIERYTQMVFPPKKVSRKRKAPPK